MTDYSPLVDKSNPCELNGLSKEVLAILDFLLAARAATGIDVVVTSTTDHPVKSKSGHPSRHCLPGTDGLGLGIDCRLRTRGLDIHRPVFDLLLPHEAQLHELIYSESPFSIKAGKRVKPIAVKDHHDHVHLSVSRGVFLKFPGGQVVTPKPEPVPVPVADGFPSFLFLLDQEDAMFKDKDDANAFLVCFAYTTLLGRPFGEREGIEALFQWVKVIQDEGVHKMWQGIAGSDEAKARRAALAVPIG